MRKLAVFAALTALALPLAAKHAPHAAFASSHREAPLTSEAPEIDSTDLYAFVSPDKPNTVTMIANYIPIEVPAGGPNFYRFGDNTRYSILIDNVGDGLPHIRYDFFFTTKFTNPNTFLYNTGKIDSLTSPNWNIVQTMKVQRTDGTGTSAVTKVLGDNLPTPPVNVGAASTPNYDALATAAISTLPSGETVFAGQRADPFFVDLGAVFDLLSIRPMAAKNALNGINVHSIALQVPIAMLTKDGQPASDPKGANAIIGVWTNASLPATTVLTPGQSGASNTGDFVSVSRLGMPLVNEVLIPVGMKDFWNATRVADDAQFKKYHDDPEPARLLKLLFNIAVPPTPRDDITAVFLTGVPGLNGPANAVLADELRLNMAIPPAATPNRLGVLGMDNAGFPNGRRLTDDVVDIEIRALAGATYPLLHPDFKPDPAAGAFTEGVPAPSKPPLSSFPYVASPFPGTP